MSRKYIVTEPSLTSLSTNQIVTLEELLVFQHEGTFDKVELETLDGQEEFLAVTLIKENT
jgi:hypothetical protein